MTVVIDTSILIDHLRGDERARATLERAFSSGSPVLGSVLTRTEILAGVRAGERRATAVLLDSMDWVAVDQDLADRAGELARSYLRSHPGIDTVDYVIAATVLREGADLLTRNVKHFPMLAELRSPY